MRSVVLKMLDIFEKNKIHATWATVGLLAFENLRTLSDFTRNLEITYANSAYSPYPVNEDKYGEIPFDILSALPEIQKILKTPGQELGSHTFGHYYTLENGQHADQFQKDLDAMRKVGDAFGHEFKSIIFPRNQINAEYLKKCSGEGLLAYRGNQQNKLWRNSAYAEESVVKRGKRFLDAYYKISQTAPVTMTSLEIKEGLVNIPASRFLRPHSGKKLLEKNKLKRIFQEMTAASANNEIYHLWWHPHNFAKNTDEHFRQLEEIIRHFKTLETKGFQSMNMMEIAAHVKK